ncbi:MAG TPA: hemolysin family protein [Sedimentibacter sp.]|nr:HlyC/CorC family transporter [Sedimentibacter sp.]NLA13332.1 HlyC/CorC family transporter [Tissierellia bacterium]HOA19490.1 hemolysin family protein [Sedimentibacter sp.]HOG62471.1 hemolysin family protein [Sedimentibacter sp.]HOT21088.1 hemolysin family protein [Sedimentibacter sp.]
MLEEGSLWGPLVLQFILLFINAIFASAEIAVISMNDNRIAKMMLEGDKRAIRLSKLTDNPSQFLSIIQVAITLAALLGGAFAAENFAGRLTGLLINIGVNIPYSVLNSVSVVLITLLLSYITLVMGELVPKRIAMKNAERLALSLSGLLYFISKLFAPVVWLLTVSTNGILRLLGIDPNETDDEVTEEDIRMMVDVGSEKGSINENEKEMIQNVFEFDNKTAEEVMTHRTEAVILWLDETEEEWDKKISESRHSRYPVCDGSADNVIGVLHVKEYYTIEDKSRENIMKMAVKPAYYVPETVRTDVLFQNMKKSRNHFAVVFDEYGGMSGIITMNDLLEQIVGDIDDDYLTPEEEEIKKIDDRTWRIKGSAYLDDVSKELGVSLPDEDFDTFGGLVFGILGIIPEDGSTLELEEYGLKIVITEIKGRRLETATVYKNVDNDEDTN